METNPREGWDEAFKQMHENGDDELLIPDDMEQLTKREYFAAMMLQGMLSNPNIMKQLGAINDYDMVLYRNLCEKAMTIAKELILDLKESEGEVEVRFDN